MPARAGRRADARRVPRPAAAARPAASPTTARSSSSRSTTRPASSAWRCSRRSAARCTSGSRSRLLARIRRRFGLTLACLHLDAGLLFRLPDLDEPPLDLLRRPDRRAGRGADPRGAARDGALRPAVPPERRRGPCSMPRPDPSKRTPLWLQRLRAKDLLQVARQLPRFPDRARDLPRMPRRGPRPAAAPRLPRRRPGRDRSAWSAAAARSASPMTSELVFALTAAYLYSWDEPQHDRRKPASAVSTRTCSGPCSATAPRPDPDWLDPQAIGRVDTRLRRVVPPAADRRRDGRVPPPARRPDRARRSSARWPPSWPPWASPAAPPSIELARHRRAPPRIAAEDLALYQSAFPDLIAEGSPIPVFTARPRRANSHPDQARSTIVERFLRTHALIGLWPTSRPAIRSRRTRRPTCSSGGPWKGKAVRLGGSDDPAGDRWAERENLAEIRRATMAVRRQESLAVAPEVFADFLLAPAARPPVRPGARARRFSRWCSTSCRG